MSAARSQACRALHAHRGRFRQAFALALLLLAGTAQSSTDSPLNLSGQWFTAASHYDHLGDESLSPFAETGGQLATGVRLDLHQAFGDYQRLKFSGEALLDQHDYRNPRETGLILERATVDWLDGEAHIPYRVLLGDFAAYQSRLTLQRAIKGASLELQPVTSLGGALHSIQIFTGSDANPIYRQPFEDSLYTGTSYLLDFGQPGALMAALVRHEQRPGDGQPSQRQDVFSLAASRNFQLPGQRISIESEFAWLDSLDPNGVDEPTRRAEDQLGYYVDLRGRAQHAPLAYGGRFESNGRDFRPSGVSLNDDARMVEGFVTWRLPSRAQLRFNSVLYEDEVSTLNPLSTLVNTLQLSQLRLLPEQRLTAMLEVARQDVRDQLDTRDSDTWQYSGSLFQRWSPSLSASQTLAYSHREDRLTADREERAVLRSGLSWHRRFLQELDLSVSPSLSYARVHGDNESRQWGGSLQATARLPGHAVTLSGSLQDTRYPTLFDGQAQSSAGVSYEFTRGAHRLMATARHEWRALDEGRDGGGMIAGIDYQLSFNGTFSRTSGLAGASAWSAASGDAAPPASVSALDALLPTGVLGLPLAQAQSRLTERYGDGGLSGAGSLAFGVSPFERLSEEQQLHVEAVEGRVAGLALGVRVSESRAARVLQEVIEEAIKRLGPPSSLAERGTLEADGLARSLAEGRVVRQYLWDLPGGVLVVGLPARLDTEVQVQMVLRVNRPAPGELFWGVH